MAKGKGKIKIDKDNEIRVPNSTTGIFTHKCQVWMQLGFEFPSGQR